MKKMEQELRKEFESQEERLYEFAKPIQVENWVRIPFCFKGSFAHANWNGEKFTSLEFSYSVSVNVEL